MAVSEPVRRWGTAGRPGEPAAQGRVPLDLIMTAAAVGTFDWDVRADLLVWDEQICALFGIDPATFDGRIATFWSTLVDDDVPATEEAVRRAIETCGEYAAEYRVRHRDGSVRWIEAHGRVLPGADGKAWRLLGVARDSTELRLARDTVARTLEHMADAFVAVDAAWRVTYLNRNAESLIGAGPEVVGSLLWDAWPVLVGEGHDRAVRAAVEHRRAAGADDVRGRHPAVVAAAGGALGGRHRRPVDLRHRRHRGARCRARPGPRPEPGRSRPARVLAYTAALAEAEGLGDVIDTVATMVLPAYGASGMLVSLLEAGRLRLAGHAGYDERAVEMLAVLALDGDTPISQVLRTRRAAVPAVPARPTSASSRTCSRPSRRRGSTPGRSCPLTVSGRTLGSLTISFAEEHDFPPDEQSLLVGLSGLIAQTLARARLRESERTLSAELQSHLLPRVLPEPTGAVGTARYEPATDGMGVGGDWYDLLELPGRAGRPGDRRRAGPQHAGRGGDGPAAQRAARLRRRGPRAGRGAVAHQPADERPRPVAVRHLLLHLGGRARPSRATVALAGHPPPLRRAADGAVEALTAPVGAPLGVAPEDEYATQQWDVAAGDVLVLFTDGLVEDSSRSLDVGLDALAEVLSAADVDDLDGLADHLMAESLPEGRRSDDVAVLVVRYRPPERLAAVTARFSVDRSDPRAARAARDAIAGFVTDPELAELRDTCVLLVSEVVTNALRHTDGRVWLELWRYPDRLRVEVSDETSRGLVTGGKGLLDESGRGVPLMDALSDRWGTAPRGDGKVVWFELDLTSPRTAP